MDTMDLWLRYLRLRWQGRRPDKFMVVEHVNPPLLDIGCGDGWLLDEMQGEDAVGIDNGQKMDLPSYPSEDPRSILESDVTEHWNLGNATFNTVTMLQIIEHLYPDEAAHCFREAYRVLTEGGRLIVTSPLTPVVWDRFFHVKCYTPESIKHWVTQDHHKPVPRFRPEVIWYWSKGSWKITRPLKHLMAQFGWTVRASYMMILRKVP